MAVRPLAEASTSRSSQNAATTAFGLAASGITVAPALECEPPGLANDVYRKGDASQRLSFEVLLARDGGWLAPGVQRAVTTVGVPRSGAAAIAGSYFAR